MTIRNVIIAVAILVATALSLLLVQAAEAAEPTFVDQSTIQCELDGEQGIITIDGTCMTPTIYAERFSMEALVEAGVAKSYTDNGDGTSTFIASNCDCQVTVETNPLERSGGKFVTTVTRIHGPLPA